MDESKLNLRERPEAGPEPAASVMITERPLRVRHYGQWAVAVVMLVIAAAIVSSLFRNKEIDHATVYKYLASAPILSGLATTVKLTAISAVIGWVIGVLVAVFRMSSNRVLSSLSSFYIWFFRGVPLLVQILIWGNFALLFKHLGVGIPFTHVMFFEVKTNTVITAFVASILGLGLNEGAYQAEVVRGGILSVGRGQVEAAKALGMTPSRTMRRVVLPQALRVIVPPTGNQFINLLKASSLVSVIAGGDLLTKAEIISAVNLRTMELLFVATFWYLVIVSLASTGQYFLERRLARGHV